MRKNLIPVVLCFILVISLMPLGAAGESAFYKGASSWAVPELDKAAGFGLITDSIKDNMAGSVTREEFAEIAVKLYEVYTGNKAQTGSVSFSDTTNPEILKAANLELVQGVGGGKYDPKALVTREQMGTILLRTLKIINPSADFSTTGVAKFADDKSISSWAQAGVYYCAKVGIIKGTGNNTFSPKGNSTREAAVIVCTRSYEFYKTAGSTQETEIASETPAVFSNDALKQSIEKLNSYRRRVKTFPTDAARGTSIDSIKEFAYIKSPLSRYIKLDFPTSGSFNEEIIIGDKCWSRMSASEEWTAWDSFELEVPLAFEYDLSTQFYPIDYGKLTFSKVGTEKVNGVNCIKYTVSGSYTDSFSFRYSDESYPITLTASGNIWIADDPVIKQAIIRQRITVKTDITTDKDAGTHSITEDIIEDDVLDINSTVIKPSQD